MPCDFIRTPLKNGRNLFRCKQCGVERTAPGTSKRYIRECSHGESKSSREPCQHLGKLARIAICKSCGNKPLPVLGCAIFGECTANKTLDGLACCLGCDRYEAKASHPQG